MTSPKRQRTSLLCLGGREASPICGCHLPCPRVLKSGVPSSLTALSGLCLLCSPQSHATPPSHLADNLLLLFGPVAFVLPMALPQAGRLGTSCYPCNLFLLFMRTSSQGIKWQGVINAGSQAQPHTC